MGAAKDFVRTSLTLAVATPLQHAPQQAAPLQRRCALYEVLYAPCGGCAGTCGALACRGAPAAPLAAGIEMKHSEVEMNTAGICINTPPTLIAHPVGSVVI